MYFKVLNYLRESKMNICASAECKNIQRKAFLWWESKRKEEQLAIEQNLAILAPVLGTAIGTLLVFIVL